MKCVAHRKSSSWSANTFCLAVTPAVELVAAGPGPGPRPGLVVMSTSGWSDACLFVTCDPTSNFDDLEPVHVRPAPTSSFSCLDRLLMLCSGFPWLSEKLAPRSKLSQSTAVWRGRVSLDWLPRSVFPSSPYNWSLVSVDSNMLHVIYPTMSLVVVISANDVMFSSTFHCQFVCLFSKIIDQFSQNFWKWSVPGQ